MNTLHRSFIFSVSISLACGAAVASGDLSASGSSPLVKAKSSETSSALPVGSSVSALRLRTDREVERWEKKLEENPNNEKAAVSLAGAYLQKARETNDPVWYAKAEGALKKALAINPDLYAAMSFQSQLHSARHEFDEAIRWTEKAIKLNPNDPYNYGNLGDIYAELGQYNKAEDNYQKMMDLRPGRSAYARASYMKELYGEEREARTLMMQAIAAGAPRGEDAAWCHVYLGHLDFNAGFLPAAEQAYEAALVAFPGYFHAYSGLGKVKAAKKDYPGAIAMYQKALESGPHHETLASLIELYTLTGQKEKAKEVRVRLGDLQKRYLQNDMDIDFEVAEIDAEHGQNLAEALKLAKDEVKTHGNVKAYDALAWIAYLNNDMPTAQAAIKEALKLGTQNPLYYYHAGKIEERLGNKQQSIKMFNRALSKCPYFHVRYAADARTTTERLVKSLQDESKVSAAPEKRPQ